MNDWQGQLAGWQGQLAGWQGQLAGSGRQAMHALVRFHENAASTRPGTQGLAALAARFVDLKQRLGHTYRRDERVLREFLAFVTDRGLRHAHDLTIGDVLAWSASRGHLGPSTRRREGCALSAFLDHLHAIGELPRPLGPFPLPVVRRVYRPYIFTTSQLHRIFSPTDPQPESQERAFHYFVTYAGALRASEAAHLRIRDFDTREGTLAIVRTKFYKDRLLPLDPRVWERLRVYRETRRRGAAPQDPLLIAPGGGAWDSSRLANAFRRDRVEEVVPPDSLAGPGGVGAPRLHCLRHSFAVHRLLKWYREGADVQAKLPLLSTWLGHSHIRHTQFYLTITTAILREGHERFTARWEKEFPLSP